jgi:hypothetical protein
MALESFASGLQTATLLDGRRLTTDLLHTPNMPRRMHDMRMSSDSSPLVCVSTICASKFTENFFCHQNVLSSPLELRLSRVSEEELLASGNSAYLQSQLTVERQRRKIGELENQVRVLEMDIMMWKTRFTSAQ